MHIHNAKIVTRMIATAAVLEHQLIAGLSERIDKKIKQMNRY